MKNSSAVNRIVFKVMLTLSIIMTSIASVRADTVCEKDTMWHYGLGNLISSGFFCPDDGGCTYISLNTLCRPDLNKGTHPFTVDLQKVPVAYWIDKDLLVCIWDDMSYMKVETMDSIPAKDVGLNMILVDDISCGDESEDVIYEFNPDEFLLRFDPKEKGWLYNMVYDYINLSKRIYRKIEKYTEQKYKYNEKVKKIKGRDPEGDWFDRELEITNFRVRLPNATFTFVNVPVNNFRDCMKIIGSFTLLRH